MPVAMGDSIGPYEILAPLGAGGMGEVYRARDRRLQRDVAIKVLPAAVAADPDRLARFEREAQVLAALNHPNIGAIYGLERSEGVNGLVLELIEGPTLADRLGHGAIPLDEALPIARQIAEALEAAHEAGIIHRDLKPANIKVRPDGSVKVLDFGLAKALGPAGASSGGLAGATQSPTLTVHATEAGIILGTAAYMAPEQARGKAVDKRADIWAFGVVLFEMLTGKRLFDGETIGDTLAQVLTKAPDLSQLPASTPAGVRQLIARCLERDPRQRLRDIGEARVVLQAPPGSQSAAAVPTASARRGLIAVTAAICLCAGLAAGTWLSGRQGASPGRVTRSVVALQADGAPIRMPVISPDGTAVVFQSRDRIWLQRLDEWQARELAGTAGGGSPFWSPDGRSIGFFTNRQLMTTGISGGTPVTVCAVPATTTSGTALRGGAAWRPDGTIVFTSEPGPEFDEMSSDVFTTDFGPLYEVAAAGGEPRVAVQPSGSVLDFHDPELLPGRTELLVVLHRAGGRNAIAVLGSSGVRIVLERPGAELRRPRFSAAGLVVYQQMRADATVSMNEQPGLWALPFSLDRLEATGEPFLIEAGLWPSLSSDGTLAYLTPPEPVERHLAWFTFDGTVVGSFASPREWREGLNVSPDGQRVLAADHDGIWAYDITTGARRRLTRGALDAMPVWVGADRIAFTRQVEGEMTVMMKPADAAGTERAIARRARFPTASADGRVLMFNALGDRPGSWEPAWIDVHGGPEIHRLGPTHMGGRFPAVSPDGRFVLYVSAETGRDEIYVTRFPRGEDKWQVSRNGGGWAAWDAKSREIYYRVGGRQADLLAVSLVDGKQLVVGEPRRLFAWNPSWGLYYAISPDNRRGLTAVPVAPVTPSSAIRIVRNWSSNSGLAGSGKR